MQRSFRTEPDELRLWSVELKSTGCARLLKLMDTGREVLATTENPTWKKQMMAMAQLIATVEMDLFSVGDEPYRSENENWAPRHATANSKWTASIVAVDGESVPEDRQQTASDDPCSIYGTQNVVVDDNDSRFSPIMRTLCRLSILFSNTW